MREMRRKDRQIRAEESKDILRDGSYGVLSTMGEDGYPYGVPMNYVFANQAIYLHCATTGHKLDNIAHNQKVSFTVVGKTEILPEKFSTKYESVIVFGRARKISGDEKTAGLSLFVDKYSSDFQDEGKAYIKKNAASTCLIEIQIEHITGKAKR